MKVVFAVVTGYLIFAVSSTLLYQLTGHDPRSAPSAGFEVVSVVWGMGFAALGGYVAERGAQREVIPSVAVGCLIAAGALISLIMGAAARTELATLLLMAPAACAGGLAMRRKPN